MKEAFLNAMKRRHACKLFDPAKTISNDDLRFILEVGRLSPSSIGLQHWKFLVITEPSLKSKVQAACMNQPQVGTASAIVVLLAKTGCLDPDGRYVNRVFREITSGNEQAFQGYLNLYKSAAGKIDRVQWSISQCHLAAANMMTAAAAIGIDSCPIGGFDPVQLSELLGITADDYVVALVLPFGYGAHEPPEKHRLAFDEVVEYVKG